MKKILINLFISILITFLNILLFYKILFSNNYFISNFSLFNLIIKNKKLFKLFKLFFYPNCFISYFVLINKINLNINLKNKNNKNNDLNLYIGNDINNKKIIIPENGLYQNILVTGCIGCGKTSSALYPFTEQLIRYKYNEHSKKLGFLILDVKGNYYKQVLEFANKYQRSNDVIVIELKGDYTYNPLNKPDLKASILANRLKEILFLFSPNNSESYWLDKAEQILENAISFIRFYNDNYVNFIELNKIITDYNYYSLQVKNLRNLFLLNKFSSSDIYNLNQCINFIQNEFYSLDERTQNILKSEITRITNCFISDYDIQHTFCPSFESENFHGFSDAIKNGKIIVLNMNISKYKNISKIIAAYLKLDFQSEMLNQLATNSQTRPMVFISDEYQEYVTSSDANFFSQSRESKCINIIATQSYTSIYSTLNNQNISNVIIQNLINKLWFRTDDISTIENIQKQIGKIEKKKFSTTYTENSKHNNYNFISKNFSSPDSTLSQSFNSYIQFDYKYDYNFFTQSLKTFECLGFISTGTNILSPQKIFMQPYFKNNKRRLQN